MRPLPQLRPGWSGSYLVVDTVVIAAAFLDGHAVLAVVEEALVTLAALSTAVWTLGGGTECGAAQGAGVCAELVVAVGGTLHGCKEGVWVKALGKDRADGRHQQPPKEAAGRSPETHTRVAHPRPPASHGRAWKLREGRRSAQPPDFSRAPAPTGPANRPNHPRLSRRVHRPPPSGWLVHSAPSAPGPRRAAQVESLALPASARPPPTPIPT